MQNDALVQSLRRIAGPSPCALPSLPQARGTIRRFRIRLCGVGSTTPGLARYHIVHALIPR